MFLFSSQLLVVCMTTKMNRKTNVVKGMKEHGQAKRCEAGIRSLLLILLRWLFGLWLPSSHIIINRFSHIRTWTSSSSSVPVRPSMQSYIDYTKYTYTHSSSTLRCIIRQSRAHVHLLGCGAFSLAPFNQSRGTRLLYITHKHTHTQVPLFQLQFQLTPHTVPAEQHHSLE